MADSIDLAQSWLEQMPEIEILTDIAKATGEPFQIRGGVPRNLVARAVHSRSVSQVPWSAPAHLIDLVDPLSDIDLVASSADQVAVLLGHVFRRLALAGFTRWEGKTKRQVEDFEHRGAMTSLDGVAIEITREGARIENVEDAVRDLEEHRLRGRLPAEGSSAYDDADAILFALRMARFGAQFGLEIDGQLKENVESRIRRGADISRLDAMRVEFAALDILLTAPTTQAAEQWIGSLPEIVPGWLRRRSRLLMHLQEAPLDQPLRVIGYPRLGAQPPRVRFDTSVRDNPALAEETTSVPWTPIRVPRFGRDGCCPPTDFMLGPLVIAWRGRPVTDASLGVVALATPTDPYDAPSRFVFAVPGIVTGGPTVVQRVDWGFVRYLAGDGRLVYIGARPVLEWEAS